MIGEKVNFDPSANEGQKSSRSYEKSTIDFPYLSLEVAEEVASTLFDASGHGPCEIDVLAAQMQQTVSGAFRQKTACSRTFGLIEKDGRSAYKLTSLGQIIVAVETNRRGRVDAFLHIPLYLQVYERYKGKTLPPSKALEREMMTLGVASKQADRARQAFDRSARHAGFFEMGENRLVRPNLERQSSSSSDRHRHESGSDPGSSKPKKRGTGGDGNEPPLHPFIQGLVQTLPSPGDSWSLDKRITWLKMASNAFDMMYGQEGGIDIVHSKNGERANVM